MVTSMQPTRPLGVAQLWSIVFWGGVWGVVLAVALRKFADSAPNPGAAGRRTNVLVTDLGGSHPDILVFEGYRLDVPRAQFSRAGKSVPLRPRTFTLLCYLARNAGRVISKAELLAQVWPGVVVTDDSLSQCVGELRAALAERGPILIRTLPKRGYLFDAAVTGDAAAVRLHLRPAIRRRSSDIGEQRTCVQCSCF